MNTPKPWASDITDLIISDQQTSGSPQLPPESRFRLASALELFLTNRAELDDHFQDLRKRLPSWPPRHNQHLAEEIAEAVVGSGIQGLSDPTLAALLLN